MEKDGETSMEVDGDTTVPDFQSLVQEGLCYVTKVASVYGAQAQRTSAKFWKALLNKAYDILDKVGTLKLYFPGVTGAIVKSVISV